MADDGRVIHKALDVSISHCGNATGIKVVEGFAEGSTAAKDEQPVETRLESLKKKVFEHEGVVVNWDAPFGIVVMEIVGGGGGPATARVSDRH